MKSGEVRLWKLTRRMVREAMAEGQIKGAIIPTGSQEQHNEHLEMEHDTASALHIAYHTALSLYPRVVVTPPVNIGVSEHWMEFPGSLTLTPGTFTTVCYEICDSLRRHGIEHILIVNGHAGNGILAKEMDDFRERLGIDVEFNSYWEAYSKEDILEHMDSGEAPAHAAEFETAFAMAAFPENVHWEGVDLDKTGPQIQSEGYRDLDPKYYAAARDHATAEKGRLMINMAIKWEAAKLERMMDGT